MSVQGKLCVKGWSLISALNTTHIRVITYHNIPIDPKGVPKGLGIEVLDEIVCLLMHPSVSHPAVQIVRCCVAPLKRCDTTPDDLDSGMGHRWMHEKTDYLIKNFNSKTLWDAFGIYGDIVVCNDSDVRCIQG